MRANETLTDDQGASVVANLYMSREAIRDLSRFLDRYPKVSISDRDEYFLFALRRIEALKSSLIPVSTDAFMESVHLSVNILGFRECLDEKYSELAKGNLKKINQLLGFEQ